MIRLCLVLSFLWSCLSLPIVPSTFQVRKAMDLYSYMPFIVIYQKDRQMLKKLEAMYQLVESRTKDYCRLFVVDCSENVKLSKEHVVEGCKVLQQSKWNLQHIQGFQPSDNRIHIRGKIFELAPEIKVFEGELNEDTLLEFANGLIPTYYKMMYNDKEIIDFLNQTSKLDIPKVVLYASPDQLESVRRINIYFYQQIDFALVPFTNQNKRPMILYVYNFGQLKFQKHIYPSLRLGDYETLKKFLAPYAPKRKLRSYELLPFPSNDTFYADVDNVSRVLYDTQLWTIVYEGDKATGQAAIERYRNKYSNYLQYVLIENDLVQSPKLYFGKEKTKEISLEDPDLVAEAAYIPFNRIEKNLISQMQVPQIIFIVEPSLLHLCSITNLEFFSHFLYCVATTEEDVPVVKAKYNIPDNESLAVLISLNKTQLNSVNLNNTSFKYVVREIYWTVFPRIKMMARMFIANPLFSSPTGKPYHVVCPSFCVMYLHNTELPNKEQLRALRQASYKYSASISFVQGDYRCHDYLFKSKSKNQEKQNPHKLLVFYYNNTLFTYKEKVSLKIVDKMIKQYQMGKLKMRPLSQQALTNEVCNYEMPSLESLLGQRRNEQSQSESEKYSQKQNQPTREATNNEHVGSGTEL